MAGKAVKLRFRSPLHVGEQGLGLEEVSTMVHSDTLYGAIYSLWCQVYGPPEGHLTLRLSSAFPYLEGEYYFPKPNLPVPALADPPGSGPGRPSRFRPWPTPMCGVSTARG